MYNPTLTFFLSHQLRSENIPVNNHTHNCYELVYFHKGKGTLFIRGNSYQIQPGLIYIVYPNAPHSEIHTADGNVSFLGFDCPNFPQSQLKEGTYNILKHQAIGNLMDSIIREATEQKEHFSELISHMLAEIILLLGRYTSTTDQSTKSLDYISAYIMEYYNQAIDFNQLARLSGYSLDYFRHLFTQEIGMSPKQFQINMRLEKAVELLASSQKSCTEIASFCGFSTSAQFSKMFFEKYGIAPNQFRRRNQ